MSQARALPQAGCWVALAEPWWVHWLAAAREL